MALTHAVLTLWLSLMPVSQTPKAPPTLKGTAWTAVEIYGTPAPAGPHKQEAYLFFDNAGRVSGSDSCNRLTGPYTLKGNGLSFGKMAVTTMACITDVPDRFLNALKGTSHYDIIDGKLNLYGATGKPLAVFTRREPEATLQGKWRLVKFQSMDDTTLTPSDRSNYTFEFAPGGKVQAQVDCNRGTGTWKSTPYGQLDLSPLALTRMACPPGSLHDHIARQWPNIRSYLIRDGHLFLALKMDSGIYELEPVPAPK